MKDWSCFHKAADFKRFQIGCGTDSMTQVCFNSIKITDSIFLPRSFPHKTFCRFLSGPSYFTVLSPTSPLSCSTPCPGAAGHLLFPWPWLLNYTVQSGGNVPLQHRLLSPIYIHTSKRYFLSIEKRISVTLKLFYGWASTATSRKPSLLNMALKLCSFCCCG